MGHHPAWWWVAAAMPPDALFLVLWTRSQVVAMSCRRTHDHLEHQWLILSKRWQRFLEILGFGADGQAWAGD